MAKASTKRTKTPSKRGAKAPRSAFRGTSKAAAKPERKAPAKAKAKRTTKRPAAAPARMPRVGVGKPNVPAPRIETLGSITVPSGSLAIFDVGLVGYLAREALEPAIVKTAVPSDRALAVIGRRVGTGRFADCWDHIAVALADGEVTQSHKLGEAAVDFARLVVMDHAALDHWRHEDSLDGLADFVFWGRDQLALAKAMNAPRRAEGYGWSNLPLPDAEAKADRAAQLKAEHKWLLATDLRPHSHHFHALAAARSSPHGAGELELGGSTLLLFFTTWGDGVFPVFADLDAANEPVQIRIQLAAGEPSIGPVREDRARAWPRSVTR